MRELYIGTQLRSLVQEEAVACCAHQEALEGYARLRRAILLPGIVGKKLGSSKLKRHVKIMPEACKGHTDCLEDDCPETQKKQDVHSTERKCSCGHIQPILKVDGMDLAEYKAESRNS